MWVILINTGFFSVLNEIKNANLTGQSQTTQYHTRETCGKGWDFIRAQHVAGMCWRPELSTESLSFSGLEATGCG